MSEKFLKVEDLVVEYRTGGKLYMQSTMFPSNWKEEKH